MKLIPLTQGKFAMVDDADFEAVNAHKWYASKDGPRFYVRRNIPRVGGRQATQRLHQFLLPGVSLVDHRDGNGLNNQRENLRLPTNQQNALNRRKFASASSKFKGVCWNYEATKWVAYITFSGQRIFLGYFPSETDAARAYDAAARTHFKDFACPNFPI